MLSFISVMTWQGSDGRAHAGVSKRWAAKRTRLCACERRGGRKRVREEEGRAKARCACVSPVIYQCFTSVSPVSRQCLTSVSPALRENTLRRAAAKKCKARAAEMGLRQSTMDSGVTEARSVTRVTSAGAARYPRRCTRPNAPETLDGPRPPHARRWPQACSIVFSIGLSIGLDRLLDRRWPQACSTGLLHRSAR